MILPQCHLYMADTLTFNYDLVSKVADRGENARAYPTLRQV